MEERGFFNGVYIRDGDGAESPRDIWYDKSMQEDAFRHRAKLRLLVLLIVLVLAIAGGWYFSRPSTMQKISSFETAALGNMAQEIQKSVSTPAALIATGTNPSSASASGNNLTREGIIEETNLQRKLNGNLPVLSENSVLDQIAAARLEDLASKQYFAHVSPSGSSALSVAAADGYQYIALGENLALGNFAGDAGVVGAWMGSPGHRANILNVHYTEIGVAAKKTIFDGAEAWLAVQVFGRPSSDCPASPASEKTSLDAAETELSDMAASLKAEQAKISAMSSSDPSYPAAASSYNNLAAQYNSLLQATRAKVSDYNARITAYNACLGG